MIITIGRKCGCCGDEIGHALEQIYHIPFYDRSGISTIFCARSSITVMTIVA